jgi:hypothetical protein
MASLFVVMFWAQLSAVAIAFARAKVEGHAVASDPYWATGKSCEPTGNLVRGHTSQEKPMGERCKGTEMPKKAARAITQPANIPGDLARFTRKRQGRYKHFLGKETQ